MTKIELRDEFIRRGVAIDPEDLAWAMAGYEIAREEASAHRAQYDELIRRNAQHHARIHALECELAVLRAP